MPLAFLLAIDGSLIDKSTFKQFMVLAVKLCLQISAALRFMNICDKTRADSYKLTIIAMASILSRYQAKNNQNCEQVKNNQTSRP